MSIQKEVLCGPFAGVVVVRRTISDGVTNFTSFWIAYCDPSSPSITSATGLSRAVVGRIHSQFQASLSVSWLFNYKSVFQTVPCDWLGSWRSRNILAFCRGTRSVQNFEWPRQQVSSHLMSNSSGGHIFISSPHHQTTSFATLLENIAIVINQHQPVVDKYYGKGKMRMVLKYVLNECDKMVENLIQNWEQERNVKSKVSQISLYQGHQGPLALDPRDIDKIISEIATMVGRWNLFELFIAETLNVTVSADADEVRHELSSTGSHQLFEQLVTTYYTPLETWYLCCIINKVVSIVLSLLGRRWRDKAHHLAVSDRSQTAATTTIPDDVFYVLKVVIKRLLSMGSVSGTRQTLEGLREAMDLNYVGVFRKRLDESVGHITTSRIDKTERESRVPLTVGCFVLTWYSAHSPILDHSQRSRCLRVAPAISSWRRCGRFYFIPLLWYRAPSSYWAIYQFFPDFKDSYTVDSEGEYVTLRWFSFLRSFRRDWMCFSTSFFDRGCAI